ncbi:hypothetical protein N0V88_002937 [Collariella sp. IMI 366227]|nr:hypothetical protein N0V88_002937 [Collariella sp. IMI 366227]
MGVFNKGRNPQASPPEPLANPDNEKPTSEAPDTSLAPSEAPHTEAADNNDSQDEGLGSPVIPTFRLVAVMTGVALGLFLSMLDSSIVATSLFTIAVEFGNVDAINWVALSYTLTYLSCAVLFARISDVVGRRVAFAVAYVLFIVFSLACGFAQNMGQLIAFRAVQGLYSVSMIIMPEMTPDHQKKYIAAVVGMLEMGVLDQWPRRRRLPPRLSLRLAQKGIPSSLHRRAWKDVDFVSTFLLISSAVLLVFPFQNASSSPTWTSALFLAPLLSGILSLVLLFLWQWYCTTHYPNLALALPPVLLKNRAYAAAAVHTMLTGFPYLLCIYAFPVTAEEQPSGVEAKVLGFLVFVGLGFGLSAAGSTMIASVEAPIWEHASAQGIVAQVRVLGGSIGIAASSAILGTKMNEVMGGASPPPEVLARVVNDPKGMPPEQWAVIKKVYTQALREDMIVCCAVMGAALVVTLGVYRKRALSLEQMMKERYREEDERRRAADEKVEGGKVPEQTV